MTVKQMEQRIRKARAAYYKGEPVMSDLAFDRLVDELRATAPGSKVLKEVGAKPAGSTGKHSIPMGSLKEAKTFEEMARWMSGVKGGFLVTDKVDGLSLSLDYAKGRLTQALTRGNGKVGEDVTANVRRMQNVKDEIPGFTGTLRGEAFMPVSTFREKYEGDYANPRNTAAGIVRRHSGEGAPDVALRYFYARNAGANGPHFQTRRSMLKFIREELGLLTVEAFRAQGIRGFKEAWRQAEMTRDTSVYEMDGVVVYVDNCFERDPGDPFLPDDALVYKFAPDVGTTTVTRIEDIAGRSGRVNPRVHVEPVKVGGVTVTHATGNNYPWLLEMNVGVGARVEVSRRGDTIPAIESVLEKGDPLLVPTACPSCGTRTKRDGAYLKCGNAGCPAKDSGAVAHWLKLIELKGVGKKMLAQLVALGVKRPHELYEEDANDFWVEHFGRNGFKVWKQLQEKKAVRAEIILAAHVPNVGRKRFRAIMDAGIPFEEILVSGPARLQAVDGIGESVADTIVAGVRREAKNILALTEHVAAEGPARESAGGALDGWAVKFTGKMERKRAELEAIAQERGARVGWKKGMRNVLVIADPTSQSNKAKAARSAGHELISEAEFMEAAGAV